MSKTIVIAESEGAARELCAGARAMSDTVILISLGCPQTGISDECIHISVPEDNIVDDAYVTVNKIVDGKKADMVFAESSSRVLNLVGRLAAHYETSAITGVFKFEDETASCMYFGGTGIRTVKSTGSIRIYTVNPGTFDSSAATGNDLVEEASFIAPERGCKRIGIESLPANSVDLGSANMVIGCGRGFQAQEDLNLAQELGKKIGAELGCSRPLAEGVDWFPREAYIGVSGKMISPRVYFAIGVSGQMQHMVGCNGAEKVIAINKDKNAPVFAQCDVGFVGDLKTVLPALTASI